MPTPRKINWNSKGERVSKAQFLERKYDMKMEFPGGGGVGGFDVKNLPWEGYGYFLEQHIPWMCVWKETVSGKKKLWI